MDQCSIANVLVVGAAQNNTRGYGNLIERGIIETKRVVTVSGIEENGYGWPNWISCSGLDLPFVDNEFDLVFSNAVIEHVGGGLEQAKYIGEHTRVGRHWFLTTPNRFFPIESHTQIFFLHMFKRYQSDQYTRLLSKSDLRDILPEGSIIRGSNLSPTLIAHCSCN